MTLSRTSAPAREPDVARPVCPVCQSAYAVRPYAWRCLISPPRRAVQDTILAKLDRDEVLFVMGHEMGHYVLGHLVQNVFMSALMVLISARRESAA